MINAGVLDRVIEVYEEVTVKGEFRDNITSKKLMFSTRAGVWFLKGDEKHQYNQIYDTQTLNFILRFRDNITTKHFIKHKQDFYNIVSIEEIGRKEGLKITANKIDE